MPELRAPASPSEQLHEAVFNTRVARHHPTCGCCHYRDATGEGFCTPAEWRFARMTDRLLDRVLAEHVTDTGRSGVEPSNTVS